MNKHLYGRLARQNLRKNFRSYGPFLLASILTVAMFYILCSLSVNPGLEGTFGGGTLGVVLALGTCVVGLFAVVFLFYTNSFLVKQRKREFGLFNVLGMEKRHLAKVIGLETLYAALISILLGLGTGMALDKAMYLLVSRLIGVPVSLGFFLSWKVMLATAGLFAAIFALIYLNSLRQVYVARPVELLQAEHAGEREPKAKWLLALIGLACLGAGYYISITTTDVLQAMFLFFVAVVLVIVGTYLLFTAGSVAMLKLLKKNRRYYYKTRHFTAVSGMIYRMKQNAVGLANICILSTMVLVMVSGTACLMLGMEGTLRSAYPYDVANDYGNAETGDMMRRALTDAGFTIENEARYTYMDAAAYRTGDDFSMYMPENITSWEEFCELFIVDLEDYNAVLGQSESLAPGEILLHIERGGAIQTDAITLFGRTYTIQKQTDLTIPYSGMLTNINNAYCLVVADMDELRALDRARYEQLYGMNTDMEPYQPAYSEIEMYSGFDIAGGLDEELRAHEVIERAWSDAAQEGSGVRLAGSYNIRGWERQFFVQLYGGLFFLGMFLGLLFTMAAILIIYYKQMSEGRDDRERFQIMQKVGMSRLEVRRTIRSQVLTVFFLPLAAAGVHMAFAFPILYRVLRMMSMYQTGTFLWCVLGAFGTFAALYAVVYSLTARTYYKLVSM